ncbi:hypothetical protein DFA_08677 [Cavenderia fasciculata]|uniref:ABC transporter B family protein n=1 Tax=Cavenderia fasciculata TaxID=261658 RepID=F4Q3M3_CACFS|nr:uncharacterized protein DFA_08677 [Cavenderia fasciculata]EGG17681.1 hypothetical protein DFA_08677 [Cavenderia fasciculata]|eukprot:XP_004356165.1 hypothetical protein DFA_08677 [Cavenderia fasciculata]
MDHDTNSIGVSDQAADGDHSVNANNNNNNNELQAVDLINNADDNVSLCPSDVNIISQNDKLKQQQQQAEEEGADKKKKKKGFFGKKKKDGKEDDKPAEEKKPMVSFFELFRYATLTEKMLMFFGSLAALANGVAMPAISLVAGQMVDSFRPENFNDPDYKLGAEVAKIAVYFVYIGIGTLVCSYIETSMWMIAGERQAKTVRQEYLKAILRQDIGWFDVTKSSELATRISSDTLLYQEGIGEKVGNYIHHNSTFLCGFIIGFTKGWQLTLVILSVTPLLAIAGGFVAKVISEFAIEGQRAYAKAGSVAEEKLGAIRTVSMFSGEEKETNRYAENLEEALAIGHKKGYTNGAGIGAVLFVIFGTYSLAFWYGSKLIFDGTNNAITGNPWTGGDVLTVLFSVIIGAMALGQAAPSMAAFAAARAAGHSIFSIVDRKSLIDPLSKDGKKLETVQGNIEFEHVQFSYPSRPDVPIFQDFTLSIKAGQTVALVGDSGGGKSSAVSLLERFYDPTGGRILLDGSDLKDINVKSLRDNIGLVSQEPVLFAVSIIENIRYGREDATMDEIIAATKAANAHDFISSLPEGYDTLVGEKGVQMSGGQKQRIAIARAMIKDPKILLLDEATSALDAESEHLVQAAINRLIQGRTNIIIAHRLTTVQHADVIAVVRGGAIVEQGKHAELLALNGVYTSLVQRQQASSEEDKLKAKILQEKTGNADDMGLAKKMQETVKDQEEEPDIQELLAKEKLEQEQLKKKEIEMVNLTPEEKEARDKAATKKKQKEMLKQKVPLRRLLKMSSPEIHLFIMGCIAALCTGSVNPIFSILLAEILTVFQNPDMDTLKKEAAMMAIWFLIVAIGSGIAHFVQIVCFNHIGERLTFRLRHISFRSIIRQEIGWFDMPENATGVLTTNLAKDATLVQGLSSDRLGLLLQNLITALVGLIIAYVSGWKLALVVTATIPAIILAGKLELDFMQGFSQKSKDAYANAGQVASEAIGAVRTVASFSSEEKIFKNYEKKLAGPMSMGFKNAQVSGIAMGFSQFVIFAVYALSYWYGGRLVDSNEWPASDSKLADTCAGPFGGPNDFWPSESVCINAINAIEGFGVMMRVFMAIVLSSQGIGQSFSFAPDMAKAKTATLSIFALIDRVSKIDPFINKGTTVNPTEIRGDIEIKNLHFTYPSRPNKKIFNGLNLVIPAGSKVALVGSSGGGKSSIISLLERFYDPAQGEITIDGQDIHGMNLKSLRSILGLVGQEPTLFSGTVYDNIVYGKPNATMEEVETAAKSANAHDFISALPNGYQTQLGDKYTQLSGGQKQRVAIARAIIRQPKILLLDEATSALDSKSEKVVQAALDNIMKGKTAIVVAHRLSTIIDSDIIAVIHNGTIIEQGNHRELMDLNGFYSRLVSKQIQ